MGKRVSPTAEILVFFSTICQVPQGISLEKDLA